MHGRVAYIGGARNVTGEMRTLKFPPNP